MDCNLTSANFDILGILLPRLLELARLVVSCLDRQSSLLSLKFSHWIFRHWFGSLTGTTNFLTLSHWFHETFSGDFELRFSAKFNGDGQTYGFTNSFLLEEFLRFTKFSPVFIISWMFGRFPGEIVIDSPFLFVFNFFNFGHAKN